MDRYFEIHVKAHKSDLIATQYSIASAKNKRYAKKDVKRLYGKNRDSAKIVFFKELNEQEIKDFIIPM